MNLDILDFKDTISYLKAVSQESGIKLSTLSSRFYSDKLRGKQLINRPPRPSKAVSFTIKEDLGKTLGLKNILLRPINSNKYTVTRNKKWELKQIGQMEIPL